MALQGAEYGGSGAKLEVAKKKFEAPIEIKVLIEVDVYNWRIGLAIRGRCVVTSAYAGQIG
jgi:hypothetical protein